MKISIVKTIKIFLKRLIFNFEYTKRIISIKIIENTYL